MRLTPQVEFVMLTTESTGTVDIGCDLLTDFGQESVDATTEEFDRLPLELTLPALVCFEDGNRTGAERTVVEEGDLGIEEKQFFQ